MKKNSPARREKLLAEFKVYLVDALYLFFLLGTFAMYRRLILAEYQISYLHYGITLVEALVLAKILFLGRLMHIDRGFGNNPLIFPTLWKSIVFSLLVGGFAIVEAVIRGLIDGQGATNSLSEFGGAGKFALIGKCVVTFFALIPFFGLKEIGQALGAGKLAEMFLRSKGESVPKPDRVGSL